MGDQGRTGRIDTANACDQDGSNHDGREDRYQTPTLKGGECRVSLLAHDLECHCCAVGVTRYRMTRPLNRFGVG